MSNLTQLTALTGSTVAPGTVTSSQYYTSVGWSAGEYIYQTPTGTIAPRTTGGIGYNSTYQAQTLLTGPTFTPGTLQTVQYSPVYDYGTYTGTTTAAGALYGTATTLATTAATTVNNFTSFPMQNGNTCFVYAMGASSYFAIYNGAGSVVVASTLVNGSANISGERRIGGCQLTNGNLVFTWFDTTGPELRGALYSSAGVLITASTTLIAGNNIRPHSITALSTGGFVIAGVSGPATTAYYRLFNPDLSFIGSLVNINFSTGSADFVFCCQITGNGNLAFSGPQSGGSVATQVYTLAGAQAWPSGGGSYSIAGTQAKQTPVYPLGGNFFGLASNSNNATCEVRVLNGTTGGNNAQLTFTTVSMTTAVDGVYGMVQFDQALIPSVFLYFTGNSNLQICRVTYTSTALTQGNFTTVNSTALGVANYTLANGGAVCNSLNGKVSVMYSAVTTQYPVMAYYNINALTNGVTVLSGINYTPKENYTLLGVAATTVAAGATGPVITNGGSVTLNANYPTVTTPVAFNYQGANNGFAQRGSVVNKVATLKGLEL